VTNSDISILYEHPSLSHTAMLCILYILGKCYKIFIKCQVISSNNNVIRSQLLIAFQELLSPDQKLNGTNPFLFQKVASFKVLNCYSIIETLLK